MKMQKYIFLGSNDWMDTQAFQGGVKVKRFCLKLVGEVRLWYESLTETYCFRLEWVTKSV